jgi:hypothetical protein
MHLVQWIWECYGRGRIIDAADARLNGEFDGDEMERVMITALWCAHPDRTLRPSIRQAIGVLRMEAPHQHAGGDIHASDASLTGRIWGHDGQQLWQRRHQTFKHRDQDVFLAEVTNPPILNKAN